MSSSNLIGIIFSKDRAMQLDAALRSFFLHCRDAEQMDVKVIYVASGPDDEIQYDTLVSEYSRVEFIRENQFKEQLLSCMKNYEYVSFQVDDNLFVRDFSIENLLGHLSNNKDALGFSMRLGMNTTYCYMLDHEQKLPEFTHLDDETLKFVWVTSGYDFGYPLEGSGSIYRVSDLYPLLSQSGIKNPNELEYIMYCNIFNYAGTKNCLLCKKNSIVFNNPINIVQNFSSSNRCGNTVRYSTAELRELFGQGYRVNVGKLSNFIPHACHQEVALEFVTVM